MAAVPALPRLPSFHFFHPRFCTFPFVFPFSNFSCPLGAPRTAVRFRCSVRGRMMKEVSGCAMGTTRGGPHEKNFHHLRSAFACGGRHHTSLRGSPPTPGYTGGTRKTCAAGAYAS